MFLIGFTFTVIVTSAAIAALVTILDAYHEEVIDMKEFLVVYFKTIGIVVAILALPLTIADWYQDDQRYTSFRGCVDNVVKIYQHDKNCYSLVCRDRPDKLRDFYVVICVVDPETLYKKHKIVQLTQPTNDLKIKIFLHMPMKVKEDLGPNEPSYIEYFGRNHDGSLWTNKHKVYDKLVAHVRSEKDIEYSRIKPELVAQELFQNQQEKEP